MNRKEEDGEKEMNTTRWARIRQTEIRIELNRLAVSYVKES
jgi:hypothetical protein